VKHCRPKFQVNTYTTWGSDGQDGSGSGVFGQRFSASGSRVGAELQINSYTTGFQGRPAVAADAGGNFVAVWSSSYRVGGDGGLVLVVRVEDRRPAVRRRGHTPGE
jgi:hypothetical protein